MVKPDISFCIPVYGTKNHVIKLLDSIEVQKGLKDIPHEVLIGCDGDGEAEKVLRGVKNKYRNMRLFYDPVNKGKFITENTLAEYSGGSRIIFVDSDDSFIDDEVILRIRERYMGYDVVSFAFINELEPGWVPRRPVVQGIERLAGGNFMVKRDVFMAVNGFSPWRCRADGPFHTRVNRLGYSTTITEEPVIKRMVRRDSLLNSDQYGEKSKLRREYRRLSSENTEAGIFVLPDFSVNPGLMEV